jgi:hypothetical protein
VCSIHRTMCIVWTWPSASPTLTGALYSWLTTQLMEVPGTHLCSGMLRGLLVVHRCVLLIGSTHQAAMVHTVYS